MPNHRLVPPLACFVLTLATAPLLAQISLQITVGPPPIPIYEQPVLPDVGYAWTPGYWAWGEDGYFWVPGTWVQVPERGMLWTPGYWAWHDDYFEFHRGYWGTHVGYYGGINYGHGYGGSGFEGGYWQGRDYYYNRSVTNVNITHVTNVYNKTVIVNNNSTIAYNGGAGGLRTAPTPQERTVEREHHLQPTTEQGQHHQLASQNRELLASVNRGKPAVAATVRPADFSPRSIVAARAPGGKVEEATLRATPRTLVQPTKNPASEATPANPTPHSAPPARTPTPGPERLPAPSPAPGRRPEPAPAPAPAPERRPQPLPAPEGRPQPIPFPERRPPPAPAPERRPQPAPAPERRPQPAPAPERRPQPAPAPERRPEPAPAPERRPPPAPHGEDKPPRQPAPHEGREPKPKPELPPG